MKIGNYNLRVVAPYLPDDEEWVLRDMEGMRYFKDQGIEDIIWIAGVHAEKWGVMGRHIYLLDGKPEQQWYIGDGKVGCFLTQYIVYSCMNVMEDSHFLFLETDCRFNDGWKEKLEQALKDVPEDFDFLFAGNCCCEDKEPVHVKGDVYEFPYRGESKKYHYPQCAHMMIIAKKAIPLLIKTQRDVANPPDVSLINFAFPSLKIFAIIPRIATQGGKTFLPK